MKKVLKFVKGGSKKESDHPGTGTRGSKESVNQLPTSSSNDSLNNNGYHVDIYGADKGMNKLHKSAYQGNMDKLKLALKVTDIDTVDELSRTALHFAITQRHTNIVWYLLNNKAKMDVMDKDGFTPFHKAVQCGNTDCTHLMLERGADIDSTDDNGNTALHLATRQGYFNIVALLLKKGADLSIFNNQGEVPLHIATLGEHKELVNLLLKYGATVNVPDRLQRTPLMLAARVGNIQLIHVFLQHGSHLDCCDCNGWTASDYALIGGHQEIAKQLAQIPRAKTSLSSEKLDMLDTIGEDSELSDVDNSLDPNINNNNELESCSVINRDISVHDSPSSCITPPPLKPPRSWDLIQSGMIDTQDANTNNTVQKRKSLTTLGSLESRRESFIENNNTMVNTPLEESTLPNNTNSVNGTIVNMNNDTMAHVESNSSSKIEMVENIVRKIEKYSPEKQFDVGNSNLKNDKIQIENVPSDCDKNYTLDCESNVEDNEYIEDDTESSSNSSSLLNELANNILVSQINKIVLEEKLSESLIDTETESPCTSAKSLETVISNSNVSEPQTLPVKVLEITTDVVKQGRAFFENKSNNDEMLKNVAVKRVKSREPIVLQKKDDLLKDNEQIEVTPSDAILGEDEELTLDGDNLVHFNCERDEEIQALIMQRNLREQQQFLMETMDSRIESKDSIELEDSLCDTVINLKETIQARNSIETSDNSMNKSSDETDDDNSLINEIKQTHFDSDAEIENTTTKKSDDIPIVKRDISNNNILVQCINTDNPLVTDLKAVNQYLTSFTSEIPPQSKELIENNNDMEADAICNSCVGPNVKSCDLMNKSCDYLINNIDQVLHHINSNTSDIVQQNQLLETHLCNESIMNMKHLETVSEKNNQADCDTQVNLPNETGKLNTQEENYKLNSRVQKDFDMNYEEIGKENLPLNAGYENKLNEDTRRPDSEIGNEQLNSENESIISEYEEDLSDDETLADLKDETLLQNAMKHLPRHKSLDLSDDSIPFIASPKVKDVPGPFVHLFDELPPPPSEFSSSFLDDQPSSASLVSLDNLPLPPEDMLEEEEGYGGGRGEKQLACIEEEETMSEMSNCKEIPYKNMEDCSLDEEDSEGDGNKTPTNEDPTPLDFDSQEQCYAYSNGRESNEEGVEKIQPISCSEISPTDLTSHQPNVDNGYQLHSMLDENTLVVEVNMNSSENGADPQCSEFHSYRDYMYTLSEQSDGSRIKDQLACYDRAIEELSHTHTYAPGGARSESNGREFVQNGGRLEQNASFTKTARAYGESEIHSLIDQDLKCLSEKLSSENHQVYSSRDSSVPNHLERLLSTEDKKRKLLVSMTNIDLADEEDKEEEDGDTDEDPPFWSSEEGGRGGRFACVRQNTVIYNEDKCDVTSPQQDEYYPGEDSMSTTSSSGLSDNHRASPKHLNPMKSTSSILRETTVERGRLEEAVGVLRSRVEVLEYQLADATQSLALKSDTVSALEETVAKHEATIAHHLQLVNTLSYQNQNYQSEINHLTSLYTKDESADRIAQLESSIHNFKKKIDYLNAQINSLSEENIVLHEFIANIDSEESKNLNIPASFKLMKKKNLEQQPHAQCTSNVNQMHNIPKEIYDDILNLKLNLEKEVMLRKQLEEKYSIELGKKLQEMEIKHAEELKKQEQMLKKEKVLKIDAELRHKKELDLERQILLHEISRLKNELKNKDLHIVKLEAQLKSREVEKSTVRKQLIDSVNREIGRE